MIIAHVYTDKYDVKVFTRAKLLQKYFHSNLSGFYNIGLVELIKLNAHFKCATALDNFLCL